MPISLSTIVIFSVYGIIGMLQKNLRIPKNPFKVKKKLVILLNGHAAINRGILIVLSS